MGPCWSNLRAGRLDKAEQIRPASADAPQSDAPAMQGDPRHALRARLHPISDPAARIRPRSGRGSIQWEAVPGP
uniref:Uncharacterized protein n=1 Tax=Tetraselmis sp. GSL018 TaxID=582737 RepID=A0A061RF36_9CHLO